MTRSVRRSTPTQAALGRESILALLAATMAVAGLLSGCGSSSPPQVSAPPDIRSPVIEDPTPVASTPITKSVAPTEFSTVTGADVAEARSRLVSMGVISTELADACEYYADHGWSHAEAWDAALSAGRSRIAEVVAEVNGVAEVIALTGEWVRSITGSVDRSTALWTEAERDAFDRAIVVRKSKLIEPLCAP